MQEMELPAEEPATRRKIPRPTPSVSEYSTSSSSDLSETEDASSSSSSSSSSSDDSAPDAANASRADRTAARRRKCVNSSASFDKDANVPLARRRRIQPPPSPHSAPMQFLPESQSSDEGPIPRNQLQVPPPPPQPIEFEEPQPLVAPMAANDRHVCINRPTTNVRDFPPILPPGVGFYRWLNVRRLNVSAEVEGALRRDLDLRRQFLMTGQLDEEQQQIIIRRVPPAYESGNNYMRALAVLAMHSFDVIDYDRRRELAFALLFCFSKISESSLDKFFTRLEPF